jgi:hypothetical protein
LSGLEPLIKSCKFFGQDVKVEGVDWNNFMDTVIGQVGAAKGESGPVGVLLLLHKCPFRIRYRALAGLAGRRRRNMDRQRPASPIRNRNRHCRDVRPRFRWPACSAANDIDRLIFAVGAGHRHGPRRAAELVGHERRSGGSGGLAKRLGGHRCAQSPGTSSVHV